MRKHNLLIIYNIYCSELFNEMFSEIRGVSPVKIIDFSNTFDRVTRNSLKGCSKGVSWKSNAKRLSLNRRMTISYNYLKSNDLILTNFKRLNSEGYSIFLEKILTNYIYDNNDLVQQLFG